MDFNKLTLCNLSHNILNKIAEYIQPHEVVNMFLISKNPNFLKFIELG